MFKFNMVTRSIMLGALVFLLVPSLSAQKIYKWTDKKGQLHFSNSPTSEVKVEEVKGLKTSSEPSSEAALEKTQKGNDAVSDPTSPIAQVPFATRWLFVLSDKKIIDVFSDLEACDQLRNLIISRNKTESTTVPKTDSIDYVKESRCVVSYALEPLTPAMLTWSSFQGS